MNKNIYYHLYNKVYNIALLIKAKNITDVNNSIGKILKERKWKPSDCVKEQILVFH